MTTNPLKPVARHRRTMRRVIPLVLVAFLGLIVGTGAPASAATSVAGALAQPGAVSPLAPSGDITAVSAALVQKIEDFNRQEADIAQQAKSLVAEAERITKDAAALRTATTAFNSKSAAVDQKASDFNSRAAALNAKISAHNSKPHTFRMPAQAAAANAYGAEANRLRAEQARLRTTKSSLQNEQNQLRKQGSQLRSKKSQLTAASSAHDAKASTLRSREKQLQALEQQLLQQMAQAIQSLDDNPPDPAAMMDQGGDAAGPPQYRDQSQSQEAGLADSPSRQQQASALKAYAKQTGTTVDMQPGTAYLTPEAVRRLPAAQAAQLGSPFITYDGLVRKPNGRYKALRVQAPGATESPGQKAFKRALTKQGRLVAYNQEVKLIIDELQDVPAPGASDPGPGTPPPRRNGKAACLTKKPGTARTSGTGWISNTSKGIKRRNLTVPSRPSTRAATAEACLTDPLEKGTEPGNANIAGWKDARKMYPEGNLARCHLIANVLGGLGEGKPNWSNLVPCWQIGLNIKGVSMRHYEMAVQSAVEGLPKNAAVHYVVTPFYRTGDSTIPKGVTMSAEVQLPNGASWPVFNEVSLLNVPYDGGPNLGN
ncbi:DNA/RNA non-specific endonuclease [Streptomyces sp. NPDC001455]|uniref:DNA/RNA non-specific endonuclease n=1 Tax=Streptomyces sp. NPDC001455 TaxID=3154518 RepID=UPI00332ED456